MLDIAIIGMGPAGMSAALTAKARNKNVKIFGNSIENSNLYKAENVNNYLGLPNITGKELLEKYKEHVISSGIEVEEKKVVEIFNMNSSFSLNVSNEFVSAKKVIIATGIQKGSSFKNEDDFLGKGVSYCATCDGMLYRGKDVAIYLENPNEESDAKFLAGVCNKVYIIKKYDEIKSEELKNLENVEICDSKKVLEIVGDTKVNKVVLDNRELNVDGFFIIRESVLLANLIKGLEFDGSSIKVDNRYETNIKGVYAVGDVIGKPYQVSKATGEGQVCVLNIIEELDKE